MSVVISLLRAIDRADGEALVMHIGEKPYVVTASGHAELASKPLTLAAMTGMLEQLLPAESRQSLNEFGAVEYQLPDDMAAPDVRYSIVAARGGDDIWIEVRRRRGPFETPMSEPHVETAPEAAPPSVDVPSSSPTEEQAAPVAIEKPQPAPREEPIVPVNDNDAGADVPIENAAPAATEPLADVVVEEPLVAAVEEQIAVMEPHKESDRFELVAQGLDVAPPLEEFASGEAEADMLPDDFTATLDFTETEAEPEFEPEPELEPEPASELKLEPAVEPEVESAPTPAVVVPLSRMSARVQAPPRPQPRVDPLQRLLQVAAGLGASALYVAPLAKPSVRVDGEIRVLDETPLTEAQLESGLLAIVPRSDLAKTSLDEIQNCFVPEVGRIQYLGFRDHRGIGAMFRMLPPRAISAEHIGLSPQIHALCTEPEGLLLVAGARTSGKSTLVAALVDQINRTRRDHIVTIEAHIQFVHENRWSFVSQREARDEAEFAESVRAAMREAPDVLVIDQVASTDVSRIALDAASRGLVVAAVTAPTTAGAVARFVEFFGADDRAHARATLAEHLRGLITQTLLRKTGGGRAAAREVLVNVPSVASMIADGQYDQLTPVMNGGRRVGMVPLNDALLGLVQSGALDVREAHRKSPDQQELLQLLNRAGLDTSFAERLA